MKLDQLRKIIREEVRSAVKEELQEVMNEAVKAASTPTFTETPAKPVQVEQKAPSKLNPVMGKTTLDEMLSMTKKNMTNEEYRNVFSGTSDMVSPGHSMASNVASQMGRNSGAAPGIDITNLDFVQKAGEVYNAANKIKR